MNEPEFKIMESDQDFNKFLKDVRDHYVDDFSFANDSSKEYAALAYQNHIARQLPKAVKTEKHLLFSIEFEGTCRGHIWLFLTDEPDLLLIQNIFIDEKYRGKGWGHLAMDFIEKQSQFLGRKKFRIWVFNTNSRAKKLYEKHGFIAVQTEMRKDL